MNVRKYCQCGVKLDRDVADEDAARLVIQRFRLEHSGKGHGPASQRDYVKAITRIIAARSKRRDDARRGHGSQRRLRLLTLVKGGR